MNLNICILLLLYIVHIGDNGMKYLCSKLHKVKFISNIELICNNITNVGIDIFSNYLKLLTNLELLWLGDNLFSLEGIYSLVNSFRFIPKLKQLGLGSILLLLLLGNNIKDSGVEILSLHMKELPLLQKLHLFDCGITDEGIKYLCTNIESISQLSDLSLNNNYISKIGVELLCNKINRCNRLLKLNIKGNNITIEDYNILKSRILSNHCNASCLDITIS